MIRISRGVMLLVAAAVLALVGIACTGDSGEDPVPSGVADLGPAASGGWEYASESQRELLADGELTFDEYERAVLATLQCFEEEGFEVVFGPELDESGFRLTWRLRGDGSAATHQRHDYCVDEYLNYIGHLWSIIHEPTEQERLEAEKTIQECMAAAGLEMPAFGSLRFVEWLNSGQAPPAFFDCVATVQRELEVDLGF